MMVTASHNPEEDNGVKIVEPGGEMMIASWEKYATDIANCDDKDLEKVLQTIINAESINMSIIGKVITGRDTRPSSSAFVASIHDALQALGCKIMDLGLVTTPQLHFAVRRQNQGLPADEHSYYRSFADAFRTSLLGADTSRTVEKLIVDASNGVGGPKAQQLALYLQSLHKIEVRNIHGKLNYRVSITQQVLEG